jgi:hypothetical protein
LPLAYLGLIARLVPRDLRITNGAGSRLLERFGHAELVELRRQLEEALALPPILAAKLGDNPERAGREPMASPGNGGTGTVVAF